MFIGFNKKEISIQHELDTKDKTYFLVQRSSRSKDGNIIKEYCVKCCESELSAGAAGHKELGYISQLHLTVVFTGSCHITASASCVK